MPTAAELIVQTLEQAGVEYVFGIPGGGTGQIFGLLHGREDRIKTILVRHEQAAAIMADAYARASGKPAVVMGQGLFIGSNASFGIMESMLSSSPMLILTDTSDGGVGMHAANQSGAGRIREHRPSGHLPGHDQVHRSGRKPQRGGSERPACHQTRHERTARSGGGRHAVSVDWRRGGRGVAALYT